jgi:5-formyltetrahydrofolate cyclo-ligase
MKKAELRTLYLERQRSLTPEQLNDGSLKIADIFFESIPLKGVKRLHCFIPIEKFREIDTFSIFHRLWKDYPEIETVAPRLNFDKGEIESVSLTEESELIENRWGILEPPSADGVRVTAIDIVLVPLICCDMRGHRVGYGKGIYDRFLGRCRPDCMKVGLNLFTPIKNIDDAGEYDIRIDRCLTPERLFTFG